MTSTSCTSDNGRYVTHGADTGAQAGHCAHMPQYVAIMLCCASFVQGRGVWGHVERCALNGGLLHNLSGLKPEVSAADTRDEYPLL